MATIVMSFPTEPGVCAEQACDDRATDAVTDGHWGRKFYLCRTHSEVFDGIDRRQRNEARCPHRIVSQGDGMRPPSPPDWCVLPRDHEGGHRMWSTARHA